MAEIDDAFKGDVRGAVVNYLRKFAEITGIDVVFYASQKVGDEWVGPVIKDGGLTVDLRNSDGGFCWDNNKIYIDINAGAHNNLSAKEVLHNTMLYTFGHEFVHFCEKWNAEEYLQFRQFVFKYMDEKMAKDYAEGKAEHRNMEELIRARMEHEGKDYDYCAREVLADALAKILPDSNFAQELAQENMTWVEQIIDMLKKFIADIKAALRGIDPVEQAPHVDIRENIGGSLQYLEEIRQMYDKLAAGAVQNYQAAMEAETQKNTTQEGSVSHSIKRTRRMTLQEQLSAYYDKAFYQSDSFYFGDTPANLTRSGLETHPLAMMQDDFKKSTRTKHNIPRRVLKKLHSAISHPVFSFTAGKQVAIMTTEIDGDGKPVVVAIHGGHNMDRKPVNVIKSIYGVDSVAQWIGQQIDGGSKFRVYDIEKTTAMLQTQGYLAAVGAESDGSWDTITQTNVGVKGENATQGENVLETEARVSYSKKRHLFKGDVFPSYKESHSDSHEVAERWSRSEEGKIQRQRLLSHHNKWYLIQVVENGVYGYQIMREVSDEKYYKGVKKYGSFGRYKSASGAFNQSASHIGGRASVRRTGSSVNSAQPEYRGEDLGLSGMDEQQVRRDKISTGQASTDRGSSKDRGRRYEPSVTTLRLDELSARSKWLQEQLKKNRVSKDKKTEYRRELREVRREMEALMPGYYPSRDKNSKMQNKESVIKPVEEDATVSGKKRGTTLSDREVLEVAALRMDTSTLTEGEQTALQIFKDRLAEMRKLQIERERLGSLWHEQQFGSGDRSEAPKTLNRMQVLDGQIERAVNSVLSVEDKQILRDVLQKARQYVKEQSVDHYRGILERRKDRSTQAQLRQKLHSTVHELSQLLLHGDKNHHVPESMKKAVAGALDVIKI